MHGGLLAASELNIGQTLFQDMCNRLQRGEYGQQSELAQIACKYNLEIVVFESGTQQWAQKPTGTHQQKHIIALRWCRESIHYDWLKRINSDEPKRVTHLPMSQIFPRHLILQRIVLLIFPKSEPGQLQKN